MPEQICTDSLARILHRGERTALRKFILYPGDYHAPSRWPRIGVPSLRSLVAKRLLVEGERGVFGPTFKLTALGDEVVKKISAE